jgi:hypothetical protein
MLRFAVLDRLVLFVCFQFATGSPWPFLQVTRGRIGARWPLVFSPIRPKDRGSR